MADISGGILASCFFYDNPPGGGLAAPTFGTMVRGDRLWSFDRQFYVAIQTDGNFVIYGSRGDFSGWAVSNFYDEYNLINKVVMQTDGNAVWQTYDGVPLLATNTQGHWGAFMVMQDDRNLVIYNSDGSWSGWSSGSQV
jgi:hypothetical protein